MNKETVLKTLLQLEEMRLRIEKGNASLDDDTIRFCQAEIASNFFADRKEWTNILKKEYGLIY